MKLINTQDLHAKTNVTRYALDQVIEHLKLKPVYQMPQGKGTVDIWDEEVVLPLILEEIRKRDKPMQATLPLAPMPDMKPLFEEIYKASRRVDDALDDVEATTTEIRDAAKKLVEQNVVLLRMLEDIRGTAYAKIDALQASIDLMPELIRIAVATQDPPHAPPPPVPAPAPATKAEEVRKRVAIVSLLPDQKNMIEREFGKVLDLRIFSGDEAQNATIRDRVANCEAVLVMGNFINGNIMDQIKKTGIKVVRINGGLTRLRDELTNLFCVV